MSSLCALASVLLAVHRPVFAPRARSVCAAATADPLAEARTAIDSIWELPCSVESCIVSDRPTASAPTSWPYMGRISREIAPKLAKISRESTASQLWGRELWEQHQSGGRYLTVVLTWPWSTVARSLAPSLLVLGAWSLIVARLQITLTANALGFLAGPLGLLLAFRVNSVVSRFHEARTVWEMMIFASRNLASTFAATEEDEMPTAARALCCRLLVAYGWAAKAAPRYEEAGLEDVLHALLPKAEAQKAAAARKPALAILDAIRRETQPRPLKSHVARAVHSSTTELNRLYARQERLLSTPLSPTYMRHAQRGLLLWLSMLPCGLLSAGCSSAGKLLLVVLATAYIMLGIEEIGAQSEQPFDVLPLHQLATVLTRDVVEVGLTE